MSSALPQSRQIASGGWQGVTDDEVELLHKHAEGDRRLIWEQELRWRTRREIVRKLPSPTGVCSAGRSVRLDDKGAYSSGYWGHEDGDRSTCFHKGDVVRDPDTPEVAAQKALLEVLR